MKGNQQSWQIVKSSQCAGSYRKEETLSLYSTVPTVVKVVWDGQEKLLNRSDC